MGYFEKIINDIETTATYIGKKAKDRIDIAKLNKDLFKETKALNRLYQNLGRISYEIHNGETEDINEIEEICDEIKKQLIAIHKLKEEVKNIQYELETEGDDMGDGNAKHTVIEEDIPKPEAGGEGFLLLKFCPNCQIGNNPEAKRCISCGHIL